MFTTNYTVFIYKKLDVMSIVLLYEINTILYKMVVDIICISHCLLGVILRKHVLYFN